jgi:hypothetical protein
MFEGLKWKSAARRSAVVIAIYLGLLYFLSVLFPESSFNLDTRAQIVSLLVNAAIFFFIFTFIYALLERSRERRISGATQRKNSEKPAQNEGDPDASPLRGRPNPNTSRKKSRRRR